MSARTGAGLDDLRAARPLAECAAAKTNPDGRRALADATETHCHLTIRSGAGTWRRGGGGNQGPPDLDELWRNFNQRLAGLFGRKRRRQRRRRRAPSFRSWAAARPARRWSWSSGSRAASTSSMEGQRGVVLRFGKYSRRRSPGRAGICRIPIETVEVVNVSQVRTVEVGYRNNVKNKVLREALMLTDDENIVDIQFAVQYTLKSPEDYLFNNRRPDETCCRRRRRRSARSSARARWTSCSTKGARRSPRARS